MGLQERESSLERPELHRLQPELLGLVAHQPQQVEAVAELEEALPQATET